MKAIAIAILALLVLPAAANAAIHVTTSVQVSPLELHRWKACQYGRVVVNLIARRHVRARFAPSIHVCHSDHHFKVDRRWRSDDRWTHPNWYQLSGRRTPMLHGVRYSIRFKNVLTQRVVKVMGAIHWSQAGWVGKAALR